MAHSLPPAPAMQRGAHYRSGDGGRLRHGTNIAAVEVVDSKVPGLWLLRRLRRRGTIPNRRDVEVLWL
jgi:hypothetical protein